MRKRGLFPYFDGARTRWGDPFRIYRRLANGPVDLGHIAPFVDEQKEPETTQALDLIAEAFEVRRLNSETGKGLTDLEVFDLIPQMERYVNGVKKNFSTGSTS